MKKNLRVVLIAFAAVICGLGAFMFLASKPDVPEKPDTKTAVVKQGKKGNSVTKNRRKKKLPELSKKKSRTQVDIARNEKPSFVLDADEEEKLTAEQRALINAIREALDNDDHKKVIKYAQKLQASPEWPDGIPVSIRKAAIEALAWFGMKGLPEIAGFLGDSNKEVVSDAIDAYDSAMMEANGDRELSTVIKTACRVVNDKDAVESFLMQLSNMRNSVAVETIKDIMENGTAAAREALPENIEFFTGEDWVKTAEDLDKWHNDPSGDNLDDDDAEEMYGPQKD